MLTQAYAERYYVTFATSSDSARERHASAKTTLDCYGHLWPTGTGPPGPPLMRC